MFDTPLFQEYDTTPEPESVTNVPAQTIWSAPALTVVGKELTVTVVAPLAADTHELPSVAITVYDPAAEAVYVDAVVPTGVDPFLQEYDVPPLAVKTTLPPEQKVVGVVVLIDAIGKALTVTTVAPLAADTQVLPSVAITVYDPAAEAVYVDAVVPTGVDPFLQEYDVPPLAVKTTLPPEQKVVAVVVLIDAIGKALTVTIT